MSLFSLLCMAGLLLAYVNCVNNATSVDILKNLVSRNMQVSRVQYFLVGFSSLGANKLSGMLLEKKC